MSAALLGSVIGLVIGIAGGAIGVCAGYRRSRSPGERTLITRTVVVIVAASVDTLIATLYAPPALRVIAMIALALIVFFGPRGRAESAERDRETSGS